MKIYLVGEFFYKGMEEPSIEPTWFSDVETARDFARDQESRWTGGYHTKIYVAELKEVDR